MKKKWSFFLKTQKLKLTNKPNKIHHIAWNPISLKPNSQSQITKYPFIHTYIYTNIAHTHAYVCVWEREREKQRENWKFTRSTHWRESWLNSKAGSLRSSDFNTEYTSKNFDLISLIVAFFCFTNKSTERVRNWERLCVFVFVKNRRVVSRLVETRCCFCYYWVYNSV